MPRFGIPQFGIPQIGIRRIGMERVRPEQRRKLGGAQRSPGALRQVAKTQGADGGALQIADRMTQQGRGAANLAVAALAHHQLQPSVLRALPQQAQPHRLAGDPIQRQAAPPGLQHVRRGLASHAHPVGLGVAVAGMGEPQGEAPVVAEQEGPTAVAIEAADGMQTNAVAQLVGQQVEHGGAPLGVATAAEHANGLVEQQGQRGVRGPQRAAVHQDPVAIGIGPIAKAGGSPIDAHPTGSQQVFSAPPGTEARGGDQLLQAFGGQGWRRHQGPEGQPHSPASRPGRGPARKSWYLFETSRFRN